MYASAEVDPELQARRPDFDFVELEWRAGCRGRRGHAFQLQDLSRGVYTLSATLTDTDSGATKNADPVTFNVLRPSVLSPQHK